MKNQKNSRFFFGFSLRSQNTKATNTQKPKKTWVFLVFHNSLTIILSKKTKKHCVFLVVSRSRPKKNKKNLGKTKKKQTWASDQTFSEKFWFFVFVGFLEVFLILSIELSQRVSKYCFLVFFFFVFLGFPHGFSPKESSNIVFLFPTCFDSVHSYYPQDILKK